VTSPSEDEERELAGELAWLARRAGAYYDNLRDASLPQALAEQLVRDWHLTQIDNLSFASFSADRLVQSVVHALRRVRTIA